MMPGTRAPGSPSARAASWSVKRGAAQWAALTKRGYVVHPGVRVEDRQGVAEFHVRDAIDGHSSGRSRMTLLLSAEARSWPSGSNISMRLTKNTMRPERPVLV